MLILVIAHLFLRKEWRVGEMRNCGLSGGRGRDCNTIEVKFGRIR